MLTFRSKKEPAIVTAPATRRDITDTHTAVSNSQNSVAGARTMVSHTLKGPKDTRGQDRMVSIINILPVTEQPLTLPRLTPGRLFRLEMDLASDVCIQCAWRIAASGAEEHAWNRF